MNARDVATRMRAIKDAVTVETGQDSPPLDTVVATLLGIDNADDTLALVLQEEAKRVEFLLGDWYRQHGVTATMQNAIGLGLVQGITFAVAAQRLRDTPGEFAGEG